MTANPVIHNPHEFGKYFEPFVGGGALFWNIPRKSKPRKSKAHISDINFHLMITYKTIKDNVEASMLEKHKKLHLEKYYKGLRIKLYKKKMRFSCNKLREIS